MTTPFPGMDPFLEDPIVFPDFHDRFIAHLSEAIQAEIMDSKSHLVEIDLLRGGQHTTAVPENWMRKFVPVFAYHVCAHCFDHFEDFLVYPIQLRDALPKINIPLLPGDGEVPVNLQQVFEGTYAAGPYYREIDYKQSVPTPSLSEADQQWADQQIANSIAGK